MRRLHTLLVLSKRSNVLALALRRALDSIATWRDEADVILKKTPVKTLFAGYGPKFIKIFEELITTGNIALIDKLQPAFDPFFCYLCEIPSIGETMARRMFFERSIKTMDDLRIAYSNNILQKIPAFGESRLRVIEEILWQTQGQAGFEPMPSFTFQYTEPSRPSLAVDSSYSMPSKQLSLGLQSNDPLEDAGVDENLSNEIPYLLRDSDTSGTVQEFAAHSKQNTRQRETQSGNIPSPSAAGRRPSQPSHVEQERPSSGALDFNRKPKIVKARSQPTLFPQKTSSEPALSPKHEEPAPAFPSAQAFHQPHAVPSHVEEILRSLFERIGRQQSETERNDDVRWLVSRCIAPPPAPDSVASLFKRLIGMLPASDIIFSDSGDRFGTALIALCDARGRGVVLALGQPDDPIPGNDADVSQQLLTMTPYDIDEIEQSLRDTARRTLHGLDQKTLIKLLRLLGMNEIYCFGIGAWRNLCAVFSV